MGAGTTWTTCRTLRTSCEPAKLLDLFCGQGGAAAGYIAAGWDVTGVDRDNHAKRYPGAFVHGDALAFLAEHGKEFDAIHASPPCQGYIDRYGRQP